VEWNAATLEIFGNEGVRRWASRAPYPKRIRIRLWLWLDSRLRWCGAISWGGSVVIDDKPAKPELIQNVLELASRKTSQKQPVVVTIRDGERRESIAPPFAVVWARTTT
jgi:hypothetical protein